jgi:hypothetical protein
MHRELIDALIAYFAAQAEHALVLRQFDPNRCGDQRRAEEDALANLYEIADRLDRTVVATCEPPGLEL